MNLINKDAFKQSIGKLNDSANALKSAYQKNLSQPVPQTVETPSTSKAMSKMMKVTDTDPEKGYKLQADFQTLQATPGSMYYNPYTKPTNKAIANLNSMGVDTTKIDDEWYKKNAYLQNYYNQSDTTNNPTKPGSKASMNENAGYQYYQVYQAQEKTNKAKSESAALRDELTFMATWSDRNYSNQEIRDMIDWSKYPTLVEMKESAAIGAPIELNEAVDMATDDWIDAVIWGARNDGGTGSIWKDMAMAYDGAGNVWHEDADIAAKLNKSDLSTYSPHSVGSTADDLCLYYNRPSFSQTDVDEIEKNTDWNDATQVKNLNALKKAETDTENAQKEADTLEKKVQNWCKKYGSKDNGEETVLKLLEREMENGDYGTLKRMDEGIEERNPIALTRAVDYRKQDVTDYIHTECLKRNGLANSTNIAQNIIGNVEKTMLAKINNIPWVNSKPDVSSPETKGPVTETPVAEETAEEETPAEPTEITAPEINPVGTTVQMPETAAPGQTNVNVAGDVAQSGATGTDVATGAPVGTEVKQQTPEQAEMQADIANGVAQMKRELGINIPQKSDIDVSNIKAKDAQTQEVATSLNDYLTPTEQSALDSFSFGANDAHAELTGVKKAIVTAAENGRREVLEAVTNASARTVMNGYILDSMDIYQDISTYETKEYNLSILEARNKQLEDELGLKIYAYPGFVQPNSKEVRIDGEKYNILFDENTGEPYWMEFWNQDTQSYFGFYNKEDVNALMGRPEVQDAVKEYRETQAKIEEAQAMAPEVTDEDMAKIEEYQSNRVYIEDLDAYLQSNKDKYDLDVETYDAAVKKLNEQTDIMLALDMDTSDIVVANVVMQELCKYATYTPTEWKPYTYGNDLVDELNAFRNGESDKYSSEEEIFQAAREKMAEYEEQIRDINFLASYNENTGLDLRENAPDIVKNIEREEKRLYREKDDIFYFLCMSDPEFDKLVEEGHQIEHKDGQGYYKTWNDWESYLLNTNFTDNFDRYVPEDSLLYKVGTSEAYRAMTQEERDIYYYLLAKEPEDADAYIYGFLNNLTYGKLQVRTTLGIQDQKRAETGTDPIGRNVEAILLSPWSALTGIMYRAYTAFSGEEYNPYASMLTVNNTRTAIRSKSSEDIKEALKDQPVAQFFANAGYDIVTMWADSAMNAAVFGSMFSEWMESSNFAVRAAAELAASAPMGASAATDAMINAKINNASDEQAYAIGAVTFWSETLTEAIDLNNMREAFAIGKELTGGTAAKFLKNWLTRAGVSEMLGESLNQYIEDAADEYYMGENSKRKQRIRAYRTAGYLKDDAELMADRDELNDILYTALIAYMSPGMDVFSTAAGTYKGYRSVQQEMNEGTHRYTLRDARNHVIEQDRQARQEAQQAEQEAEERWSQGMPALDQQRLERWTATPETIQQAARNAAQQRVQTQQQAEDVAVDFEILENALEGDWAAHDASVAAVLDTEGTEESREVAQAAAVAMHDILGPEVTPAEFMQDVLTGALTMGINPTDVKQAVTVAALGGQESHARQLLQDENFRNSRPDVQAFALTRALQKDIQSGVQGQVAQLTHDHRVAVIEGELMATQYGDQIREADNKVTEAIASMEKAQERLTAQYAVEEAKAQAALEAKNRFLEDQTEDNLQAMLQAQREQGHAEDVSYEYEQALQNENEKVENAKKDAERIKQAVLTQIRESAESIVAQEEQERAELKQRMAQEAQAQQEEQARIDAEQAEELARQQAIDDERSGLTEDLADEEKINALVERTGLTGEDAEQLTQTLVDVRNAVRSGQVDTSQMITTQEAEQVLGRLSRAINTPIAVVDTEQNVRGYYENGTIYLSNRLTVGQAAVEAALHEVTHALESTNAYDTYAQVALESLYATPEELQAAVDNMLQTYEEAGKPLLDDEEGREDGRHLTAQDKAKRELVAEFTRTQLNNRDVINRIVDTGIGGTIRNALHNINQYLKNMRLEGEDRVNAEYLRKAERQLQKAIRERQKSEAHPSEAQFSIQQFAQANGMYFDPVTLDLYDRKGGTKITTVTPDMIDATPVGMLIDLAENGVRNKKGAVTFASTISSETAQAQKEMLAGLMTMIANYKDSDLVWEIAASTMFSALKSNSDPQYSTTVDFGTVCAKTQEIINVLSRTMLEKGRGLTRAEVLKVYNEVANTGLTVPCPVCYVFSRWMGVPSLLGQMSEFQDRFVVLNDDGTINRGATQENVDSYINNAIGKFGSAKKINSVKTVLINGLAKQETIRIESLKVMESETATAEEKADAKQKHDAAVAEQDSIEKDLVEVNAYNWVTQALCKEENGKFVVDDEYQYTPKDVLFDLRKTGEFAKHTKNWKYRNTRGAGMGKAIMPYSGEQIGDILHGTTRWSVEQNPFLNGDIKAGVKALKSAVNRVKQQNLIGGQRLQSTSDFRPEWGLDYMMSFLELQAAGSKVQMYTKVAEAVDLLASMGADVNLSIMGKGKGWHVDSDGRMVLDFSSVTGMDYDTAKGLKDKYDNVQMILVGMNDTHIRLAMADSDIDFIIPWHSSGNSQSVLSSLIASVGENLETSSDYTDSQTDKPSANQTEEQKELWNLRMKILTGAKLTEADRVAIYSDPYLNTLYQRFNVEGVDPDCYKVKLKKDQANQIFPYEYWDKTLTKDQADQNGKLFVEYCEHFGLDPRFSQFKDDPGYWKLLIDRSMYDNNGNYREQQVVDVTKAKIGYLDEGKLTDSDMPIATSAMYGPQYSELENEAVYNALAAIERQYSVNNGLFDGLTQADQLQMLQDAGVDLTAEDRIDRQNNQYDDVLNAISDIPENRKGTPGDGVEPNSYTDLTRQMPSDVSITDLLKAVNTDRVRYFDKEGLNNTNLEARSHLVNGTNYTQADLIQMLQDAGVNITPTNAQGMRGRQFGTQTAQNNPVLAPEVNEYLNNYSGYAPDTNNAQMARAYQWVANQATATDPNGYNNALSIVTDPNFNYATADGQTQTLAVMSMAIANNDVMAQGRLGQLFNEQGTTIARALQARKIFMMMTPDGRVQSIQNTVDDINDQIGRRTGRRGEVQLSPETEQAIRDADTDDAMRDARRRAAHDIADQLPVNWMDKLQAWRMLSMLFNPKTHGRNFIGNMIFVPVVSMKNKVGALMETTFRTERTKTLKPVSSREIRSFARQDAMEMRDTLTGEAKFNEAQQANRSKNAFKTKLLQVLSDFNGKALEGEDWFFLKGHYRRALGGWMEANNYTPAQLQADQELLDKGRQYAIEEAQKATYRDFNKLAQTLNKVSRDGGVAGFVVDAVLPFKKTPANILRRGIEYSAVGLAKSLTVDLYHMYQWQQYQKGKLDTLPAKAISPTQLIDKISAGLTGIGIMALGAILNSMGVVTCGLVGDDDEYEKLRGKQKYALNLSFLGTDATYTIDWAAPFCLPFFTGAAYNEITSRETGEFNAWNIVDSILGIAEPVFNLSMLEGVSSLFSTSQNVDVNTLTQIIAKIGSNYATSFVPTVLGATARTIDPVRRKAFVKSGEGGGVSGTFRYAWEQTENKIPGVSQSNIPIRDAFGRTEEKSLLANIADNFLFPGYYKEYDDNDPVINELEDLYGNADEDKKNKLLPKLPNKTFQVNGKTKVLEGQEIDRLTEERGTMAYDLLEQLFASDYYKSADDESKADMIADVWTYATQNANYNIDNDYKVTTWVLNSRNDPLSGIIKRDQARVTEDTKESWKHLAVQAVSEGDNEALDSCVEALGELGVKESSVKTYVGNAYKEDYIRAYQDGDEMRMLEIEDTLMNTDLGFSEKDFQKWINNMNAQTDLDTEDD